MHAGEAGELGGWFCGAGRRLSPSKGQIESDVIMVDAWEIGDVVRHGSLSHPFGSASLFGYQDLSARWWQGLLWLSFSVDSSQIPGKIGWGFNFVSPPLLPPPPPPSFPPSPIPLRSPFLFSLLSNIFLLRLAFKQE